MGKKPNGSERSASRVLAAPLDATAGGTPARSPAPKSGSAVLPRVKSLMKTTSLSKRGARPSDVAPRLPGRTAKKAQLRAGDRTQKIEERIGSASEELASGITQSASAAEELRRAMEQIASGAEEAAAASQETLAVASATATSLTRARELAAAAKARTEALQATIAESVNQIGAWAGNIRQNGERQAASVSVMDLLMQQAASIGEVTKTIGHVSDQTNLLALNAAIEAARASDQGRGFAVVADEVRALAETSEKSARDAQSLADRIQAEVKSIAELIGSAAQAATGEAERSQTTIAALVELRKEIAALADISQVIANGAQEAEGAAREAQKGAEVISSAAEEQAAASSEALRSVEQQSAALDECQASTQAVASMAGRIGANKGTASAIQLASAAEQLSAAIQEISGAAAQVMTAVEQISRGGQQQASASQQASAAINQIEKTSQTARENAASSLARARQGVAMLAEIRQSVSALSAGVLRALDTTRQGLSMVGGLEAVARSVEKIVEGIGMVSIQTNMLAVSGSVEAARAGDLGKGFAVVSKDIRSLARDSAQNVENAKDTVRAIQSQIATVRREMEAILSASEIENQKNAAVLANLTVVQNDMGQLAESSQQILTSSEAILGSLKEAVRGTQQIAAAAEEASSASAEAAAAARQQAQGAEELAAAIEEIASLAEDIQGRNG
jgi:methyl-accepting chemotaxis protein